MKILEEEIEHRKHTIRQLLAEKEKYEHDTEIANQQYYTSLEELKLQEMQVHELNKKIIADQLKLKQKQSLYESVRSDRNLFSKQLIDSQDEIMSLKKKFKSMNHQIDQMKEDISLKDHAIVKEHFLHHSVDKERELLKNELTKIKKQVQASEGIIENQRVEIMKLQRIIEEAEQERQRQRNELSSVLSERNLLTSQLVKRNDELNQMYEKIKTQRGDLKMGELNFNKFSHEINHWQNEIRKLVETNNEVIESLTDYELLVRKIKQLEKDILKEKTRSRALMDELETPMNVHRWRILESSDPKRYDKILQIQSLQKQLVAMSDKVIQNDLLIQEKEKIYVELKNVIARHPGPEVEEQILLYQQTLKDKQKQLTAMNGELEMYIEQVKRFKEEISDYDLELLKINKAWVKTAQKSHKT
jgi:chromosome segregation ATPase